jgi:hypothetical protein
VRLEGRRSRGDTLYVGLCVLMGARKGDPSKSNGPLWSEFISLATLASDLESERLLKGNYTAEGVDQDDAPWACSRHTSW